MSFNSRPLLLGDSSVSAVQADRLPLSVYVLATSISGTRGALEAAASHARDLDACVVLLVPIVVPYALTLEHPADSPTFVADRFRSLAEALGIDVTIRICLCRPQHATLAPFIPRDAVILVGGRTRRWWPSREQRLAAALTRTGHQVVFISAAR